MKLIDSDWLLCTLVDFEGAWIWLILMYFDGPEDSDDWKEIIFTSTITWSNGNGNGNGDDNGPEDPDDWKELEDVGVLHVGRNMGQHLKFKSINSVYPNFIQSPYIAIFIMFIGH